jgi:hypothetical protein
MAFEAAAAALCRLAFGQGGEEARRRPPSVVGLGGEIGRTNWATGSRSSARRSSMRALSPRSVVFHAAPPGRAMPKLAVKMQRRRLDGDAGDHGRIGCEAACRARFIEIGQPSSASMIRRPARSRASANSSTMVRHVHFSVSPRDMCGWPSAGKNFFPCPHRLFLGSVSELTLGRAKVSFF